ncbi:RNA polymerase sigma factor [Hydrogenibacillus sp. N12]|uniref:RNA polymerase sigma factor n=1 Tax=Hydrogenibacillus sp. N12 TaxID=2866627 RepID=UPI001C7D643D|nr:RNA polymerase sigma factor [Hydrogenibacillus sp. N12]QZA33402.1 RNA polymerase sigma factor [Hydrogenibacillus sp. N12]
MEAGRGGGKGRIDPATFEAVYRRYAPAVYHVALAILGDPALAEDVTHDVFLAWLKAPERYDAGRGSLGAYLLVMARSRSLDLLRRSRRERAAAQPAAARAVDPWEAIERRLWAEGLRPALIAGLFELSEGERAAVIGHYGLGLSHRALATALGRPLGTVKSQLRSGLGRLRRSLGRLGPWGPPGPSAPARGGRSPLSGEGGGLGTAGPGAGDGR